MVCSYIYKPTSFEVYGLGVLRNECQDTLMSTNHLTRSARRCGHHSLPHFTSLPAGRSKLYIATYVYCMHTADCYILRGSICIHDADAALPLPFIGALMTPRRRRSRYKATRIRMLGATSADTSSSMFPTR